MKIKFLGTAAAEGVPGIFCECETCRKSRELGGKNIRTRSQAIVDGKILIDFPADTYFHSLAHNVELSRIKTCIITHSHQDHLYPAELWSRNVGIAHMDNVEPLNVYAAKSGYRKVADAIIGFDLEESKRVVAHKVIPYEPFEAEGYTITPMKANHDQKADPMIYLIQKDGKSMLYAHDTGYFPEETTEYLKNSGVKLDFVTFDCCGAVAFDEDYGKWGHMNLKSDVVMRDILTKNGNITENTVCVVNHFSHNGAPLHDEMEAAAAKDGFITAYDGFETEF